MGAIFLLLLICLARLSQSKFITSYFINSDFNFRATQNSEDPNQACLHTDPNTILAFPSKVTICYRAKVLMYINYEDPWSRVVGFGTIQSDFLDMEEGVLFGFWKSAPWIAIKYKSSESWNWVGIGKNLLPDLHVWRHTCLSMDFDDGSVKLEFILFS